MTDPEDFTAGAMPAGQGEARARQRRRRIWLAMLLPALIALAVLMAVKLGMGEALRPVDGRLHPAFAVLFCVVIGLFTLIGSVWHHRLIDEQEERAILWGNTVGFYAAVASMMMADALTMAGLIQPVSHVAAIIGAAALSVLTYCWHRFR